MNSSRVLVLGAAGFIGRRLAESLACDEIEVVAATREPTTFVHQGIRNVVATYDSAHHFAVALSGCTAVIHAASESTPGSSAAQPQLDGNLRTTLALIEALQAMPLTRLVFLSSGGAVYGERNTPARESDPLRPRSYHGAGKVAAEQFIHAWATQYDGTALLFRPSNIYGPGQLPQHGFAIIPSAFQCVLQARPLRIWGSGSTLRDYLYIEDFLELCKAGIGSSLGCGAHVFNAASGVSTSLDSLLERIDCITKESLVRLYEPSRLVDVHRVAIDCSAARAAFAWSPTTSLDEGLHKTWQWLAGKP